jgi:ABC-type tungstate transport system permease subunit
MRNTILAFIAFLGIAVFLPGHAMAQEKSIVIASTTSTQDSGLFGHLLPIFTQTTGIAVKVLAQGGIQSSAPSAAALAPPPATQPPHPRVA